jgi:hypothetical protein
LKIGKIINLLVYMAIVLILFTLLGCPGPNENPKVPGTNTVTVTWEANPEIPVNEIGGGYKVYYSKKSGFSVNDPKVSSKDVPYVAGPFAPTSTTLLLEDGKWYIKVVAYMDFYGISTSRPSRQVRISVP